MKNLVVFGDSFQNPSYDLPGSHWSEIISTRNNLNLINLANCGCSTRYVTFQMLQSIDIEDSIIVGSHAAHPGRVEFLTQEHRNYDDVDITSFENYYYPCRPNESNPSFIKSINLFSILNDDSISTIDKNFLMNRISSGLMQHIDRWAMFYGLSQFKLKNKNFLYLSSLIKFWNLFSDEDLMKSFDSKNIMTANELSFNDYFIDKYGPDGQGFIDPGYHTEPASQFIIADKIELKLKKNGWL